MRANIPNLAIRTTFIVGYPGETEEEFQALMDFVQEIRFDRVGAFQFSFEPGTTSEPLGDPVPAEVKQERLDRLMEMQQGISLQVNQAQVGQDAGCAGGGFGQGHLHRALLPRRAGDRWDGVRGRQGEGGGDRAGTHHGRDGL